MITLRDGDQRPGAMNRCVVAIGVFDGLHRGHQALIARVVELSKRDDACVSVVTFDPSPAMVLAPETEPRLIATIDQRLEGLESLGVELVRVLTFDADLARESARDFIDRVLVGELSVRCVVVGEDFHFGHDREGSVELLREVGVKKGFEVVAAPIYGDVTRWSSSYVREALVRGDLDGARRVLGHPFRLRGVVVAGDQRGAALGYPTANLALSQYQLLPLEGVYAGACLIAGQWWPAAISVGTRPQFYDDATSLVEVFVLGFEGDLYGVTLDVVFFKYLRGQLTFSGADALVRQIGLDVGQTAEVFEEASHVDVELLGLDLGQRR